VKLRTVVLTIGQLGLGGAERQLVLLAIGLQRAGVDVTVVCHRGGPRLEELTRAGVPVHVVSPSPWSRRFPRLWILPDTVRSLLLLRQLRPQVVHAYLFHAYVFMAVVARVTRVPVMVAGRRSLGIFKAGSRRLLLAERLATRITNAVVPNSEAVALDTLERERLDPGKLRVIPNALPPELFDEAVPAALDVPAPRVVCVANLHHYKGHRYLIEAAGRLRAEGRLLSLVLVGDGTERASLEAQAGRSGVPTAFLGKRLDVPSILAAGDIFALPSLQEGMSNAVMEAMAAGVPVVATDVGGNAEALAGNGLLCPPADSDALADRLRSLLDDDELRRRLAERAREHARTAFTLDALTTAHIALYEELLERRCAG
jgi:glycosyltransferase involved in cell wall biosynthesis